MNFLQFFLQRISNFLGAFNQSASTSSTPLFITAEGSILQDVLPTGKSFGLFNQLLFNRGVLDSNKSIISINGNPVADNQAITFPSGATLHVDGLTGAFIYNPNSAIDAQPGAPVIETFTYTYLGFLARPTTLTAKVIIFDTSGSNSGGNSSDPSNGGNSADPSNPTVPAAPPVFTQLSDALDLNGVTSGNIAQEGISAYRAALAGDDTAVLPGLNTALTNAGFYNAPFSGGSGNDTIVIDGTIGLALNQTIQVEGNSGNDRLVIDPTSDAGRVIGKLTLDGGTGNDQYTFENITSVTELSIVESSVLADEDVLQILSPSGLSLQVSASVFNLGLGDDTYLIDGDLVNSRIVDAAGESSIVITGNVYGDNYDDSSIATGAQNDVVNVTGAVTNASITTGDGDDDVLISGAMTNSQVDVQNGDNTVNTGSLLSSSAVVFGVGANTVNVDGDVTHSYIYTLAADALDDNVIIQGNLNDQSIIQLSSGDDIVTVNGSTEYSDIRAGGGNNTITFNDNVTNANITSTGTGNQLLTINGNFTANVAGRGQVIFETGNHQINITGSIIGTNNTLLATIASDSPGTTTLSVGSEIQFTRVFLGDDDDSVTAIIISDSIIDMGTGQNNQINIVDPINPGNGAIMNSTILVGEPNPSPETVEVSQLTVLAPNITNTTFELQNIVGGNQLTLEGVSVNGSNFNGSDSQDLIGFALSDALSQSTIDISGAGDDMISFNDTFVDQLILMVGNGNDLISGNNLLQNGTISISGDPGVDSNVTFSIDLTTSTITIEESVKDTDVLTFQSLFDGTLTGSGGLDRVDIVNVISSDGRDGATIDLQSGDDLLTGTGTQPGIIGSMINMGIDNDTISGFSTVENSQLYLGEGNDTLLMLDTLGWFDNSLVDGGDGDDIIEIVNGNGSTVIDGAGNDTVTIVQGSITIDSGNDGFADSFVFEPTDPAAPDFTNGDHTINGFESGSDVIDLTAFNTTLAPSDIVFDGNDTTIAVTSVYSVTVTGVELNSGSIGTDILL